MLLSKDIIKRNNTISLLLALIVLLFFSLNFFFKIDLISQKLDDKLHGANTLFSSYFYSVSADMINSLSFSDFTKSSVKSTYEKPIDFMLKKHKALRCVYVVNKFGDVIYHKLNDGFSSYIRDFSGITLKKEASNFDNFAHIKTYINNEKSIPIVISALNELFVVEFDIEQLQNHLISRQILTDNIMIFNSNNNMLFFKAKKNLAGSMIYENIVHSMNDNAMKIERANDNLQVFKMIKNDTYGIKILVYYDFLELFSSVISMGILLIFTLFFVVLVSVFLSKYIKFHITYPIEILRDMLLNTNRSNLEDLLKYVTFNAEFSDIFNAIKKSNKRYFLVRNVAKNSYRQSNYIFNKSSVVFLVVDAFSGKIVKTSAMAAKFYGYGEKELLDKTIFDIEISNSKNFSSLDELIANDATIYNAKHRTKNGYILDVKVELTHMKLRSKFYKIIIVQDISNQTKLLNSVKNEYKFINISPFLSFSFKDKEIHKVDSVSNNITTILGYAQHEILDSNFDFHTLIYKDDLTLIVNQFKINLRLFASNAISAKSQFEAICRILNKNGQYTWAHMYFKFLKDQNGEFLSTMIYCVQYDSEIAAQNRAKEQINHYKDVLWAIGVIIWEMDLNKDKITLSEGFRKLLGYEKDETSVMQIEQFMQMIEKNDFTKLDAAIASHKNGQNDEFSQEVKLIDRFNNYIWILMRGRIVLNDEKEMRIIGSIVDINDRKKYDIKNRVSSKIFAYTNQAIAITDEFGNIINVNGAFSKITGYSKSEAIGKSPKILKSGYHDEKFYQQMWQCILTNDYFKGEIYNKKKNGEIYPEILTIATIKDEFGKIKNYISIFSDISSTKGDQFEYIARHDDLTGLANRRLLNETLSKAMNVAEKTDARIMVCLFDIDEFKKIGDTFGGCAKDHALIEISNRISEILKKGDLIARIGIDEFVVVITDNKNLDGYIGIMEQILNKVNENITFGENDFNVSVSIGATFYPQNDDISSDTLIRQANAAMYHAKNSGKNRFCIYDNSSGTEILLSCDDIKDINKLKDIFEKKEIFLHFTPRINIKNGIISSFDVNIDFGEFMISKAAQNSDIYDEILIFAIKEAFEIQRECYEKTSKIFDLCFEFSQELLKKDSFFEKFSQIFKENENFDIKTLNIGLLTQSQDSCVQRYNDLGAKIFVATLDYSFLQCKYNKIVIPPQFVQNFYQKVEVFNSFKIIANAHKILGKDIVICGVDNEQILRAVIGFGFENIQGEIIAKAMYKSELLKWLQTYKFKPEKYDFEPFDELNFTLLNIFISQMEQLNLQNDFSNFDRENFEKTFNVSMIEISTNLANSAQVSKILSVFEKIKDKFYELIKSNGDQKDEITEDLWALKCKMIDLIQGSFTNWKNLV